jgi:GR25 family glycosyltransferase involved in LPS biosynthesis
MDYETAAPVDDRVTETKPITVYVLNLDRDMDRLNYMLQQIHFSDLRFDRLVRFPAIDGRTLQVRPLVTPLAYKEITDGDKNSFRDQHYQLTRGAVGCYMSHVGIWKKIAEEDELTAIILEDDAIINPELKRTVTEFTQVVPKDWDILLIGHMLRKYYKGKTYHKVVQFYGLHCYVISAKGARNILKYDKLMPLEKQVDSMLSDMCEQNKLKVYAYPTSLSTQNNVRFKTTIQIPVRMRSA